MIEKESSTDTENEGTKSEKGLIDLTERERTTVEDRKGQHCRGRATRQTSPIAQRGEMRTEEKEPDTRR